MLVITDITITRILCFIELSRNLSEIPILLLRQLPNLLYSLVIISIMYTKHIVAHWCPFSSNNVLYNKFYSKERLFRNLINFIKQSPISTFFKALLLFYWNIIIFMLKSEVEAFAITFNLKEYTIGRLSKIKVFTK